MSFLNANISAPMACSECLVRKLAICSDCQDEEFRGFEQTKKHVSYRAGDTIVWAGDNSTFMGSLISGVATLSLTLADGRRQLLGLLLPSGLIGYAVQAVSTYDITAITDVTLCCFARSDFEILMNKSPAIRNRFIEIIVNELDLAREWMLILGRKTAREKVISFLIILCRCQSPTADLKDGVSFNLFLSREQIADFLGLRLETVSRQLSALKRDGMISMGNACEVTVPDFGALLAESGK